MNLNVLVDGIAGSSTLVIDNIQGQKYVLSFDQLKDRVLALAGQLQQAGLKQGHKVGIQAPNCLEWLEFDLACLQIGAKVVAIPTDSGSVLIDSLGLDLLVTSVESPRSLSHYYEAIFLNGGWFKDVSKLKLRQAPVLEPLASHDDILTLTFSSGTTGVLKGLVITKSGAQCSIAKFVEDFALSAADSTIIFLPLSNFQQRMLVYGCLLSGVSMVFTDFTAVFRSLKTHAPTFLIAPPALYEQLHKMYKPAKDQGKALIEGLGGKVRFLITGMAPIQTKIIEQFNQAGIRLLEVYGVTETGMIAWNKLQDNAIGTVGKPIFNDVVISESAEIFVKRHAPLTLGYFVDPNQDGAQTFLADGMIATGDLGRFDEQGRLILVGRKKDIIVTSGGKKFHPGLVEQEIEQVAGVEKVVLIQNKTQPSQLVAIIKTHEQHPDSQEQIRVQMQTLNDALPHYMKVNQYIFTDVAFDAQSGLLTRNLKLNRSAIHDYFLPNI